MGGAAASAGTSYEGKAKIVRPHPNGVSLYFKDAATAFNGAKKAEIPGKGALAAQISALCFAHLEARGFPTHYLQQQASQPHVLVCRQARMVALEVVVRFAAAGSLVKRLGLAAGTVCDPPAVEFYLKNDALGDPLVNSDHIRLLQLASAEQVAALSTQGMRAALALRAFFAGAGMRLVDIKLEYGYHGDNLVLADEISPDICRLHDSATGRSLDKDLFRFDGGDLLAGYREVLARLQAVPAEGAP